MERACLVGPKFKNQSGVLSNTLPSKWKLLDLPLRTLRSQAPGTASPLLPLHSTSTDHDLQHPCTFTPVRSSPPPYLSINSTVFLWSLTPSLSLCYPHCGECHSFNFQLFIHTFPGGPVSPCSPFVPGGPTGPAIPCKELKEMWERWTSIKTQLKHIDDTEFNYIPACFPGKPGVPSFPGMPSLPGTPGFPPSPCGKQKV